MISCVIGHAFQTGGEMSEGWLSGLLFLPITHLVYFFGSMVVLADLNHLWLPLIFILSSAAFFVSNRKAWLVGVAFASSLLSWKGINGFYALMSV
tara:strand:- start:5257 stop:5541 length:285 start_codon:yes stop_codon:yes gene_type:complete